MTNTLHNSIKDNFQKKILIYYREQLSEKILDSSSAGYDSKILWLCVQ